METSEGTTKTTLIALLSILREKGVLDPEEVEDIRRHGKLAPHLISKGLITQEEFELRYTEVRKIMEIATRILGGQPATPVMINVLRAHQDKFPGLIGSLMRAVQPETV